jgi:hypothetical protein
MCWQLLLKVPSIKAHENPFVAFRVVTCGQMDELVDMAKTIGAFIAIFVGYAPK